MYAVTFIVGYALWHLDFQTCRMLRQFRHEIGIPYGFLLEFHGWWHVLTGLSGAAYIECIHILGCCKTRTRGVVPVSKVRCSWDKYDLV